MTQLTLNNRIITATEKSTFYTNFGQYSNLFHTLKKSPQTKLIL